MLPVQVFLSVPSLNPSLQKHSTSLVVWPVVPVMPYFKRQPCLQSRLASEHNWVIVTSKIGTLRRFAQIPSYKKAVLQTVPRDAFVNRHIHICVIILFIRFQLMHVHVHHSPL